jgi:hypothetical protein
MMRRGQIGRQPEMAWLGALRGAQDRQRLGDLTQTQMQRPQVGGLVGGAFLTFPQSLAGLGRAICKSRR